MVMKEMPREESAEEKPLLTVTSQVGGARDGAGGGGPGAGTRAWSSIEAPQGVGRTAISWGTSTRYRTPSTGGVHAPDLPLEHRILLLANPDVREGIVEGKGRSSTYRF